MNQQMSQISKELWQFLIENAITIIVECLPAKLNSLVEKDSSEQKLNLRIFQKLFYVKGCTERDLLATRVTIQFQACFS